MAVTLFRDINEGWLQGPSVVDSVHGMFPCLYGALLRSFEQWDVA